MFLSGSLFADDPAQVSTAPVRARKEESPLMLNIVKDSYDSRVGLDYSIRWDFSDLTKFRPGLKTLADGIAAVRNWDITENTRVRYYGFATNPWRIFIARDKVGDVPASASSGGSEMTSTGAESPVYKKRLRLSFSPLVDDFKRNLDDNLRTVLLQNSLSQVKTVGPQWQKVGNQGKKDFFNDVLSLDIWHAPGLDSTKHGLEYISK